MTARSNNCARRSSSTPISGRPIGTWESVSSRSSGTQKLSPIYRKPWTFSEATQGQLPRQHRHLFGEEVARNYQDEMGNRYNIRIQGTRIKHTMGPVSIKRYDKFGLILRIETTVNDVSFFKHYRQVEHRNGSKEMKYAAMLKTIYMSARPAGTAGGGQPRYLEFLSALEDDSNGSN